MANLNIPVGVSDFEKIRNNGFYYVDKSGLIAEILKDEPTEVTLITRPRRFGKTLGMSMLRSFFDIRRDSRELFRGLEIAKDNSLCEQWMNQCPTIFFTLKDIDGLNFDEAYGQLAAQISDLYKEYTYLLDSVQVDEDDKKSFLELKAGKADKIQVSRALNILMRMVQNYYGKPVILLLDEYDVPIAKASSHGYYGQMLNLIKIMMSTALKDNCSLQFAVITGCLKIAKESIFTGTNNLVSDTITDSMRAAIDETNRRREIQQKYNEEHGITPQTIKKAVRDLIAISKAVSANEEEFKKDPESMDARELEKLVKELTKKMRQAAAELNFEEAAKLRDRMKEVKQMLLELEDH